MAYSLNFDRRLKRALDEVAPEYKWFPGWLADSRSKVDLAGLKDGVPHVVVEVELKKDNPVENVVKIWRWAQLAKNKKRVLFLHAFSGHYVSAQARRMKHLPKAKQYERAVFIGERMRRDSSRKIGYKPLLIYTMTRAGDLIQYTPLMRRGSVTKAGGGAMRRAADTLAQDIAKIVRSKSNA